MELKTLKDIIALNNLANQWLNDYESNNLGGHSASLKKQSGEMRQLKNKTERLIEEQSGDTPLDGDWKALLNNIQKLAKSSPVFAACFTPNAPLLQSGASVSKEVAVLAIKLSNMTAAWLGKYSQDSKDKSTIQLVQLLHDQAKTAMKAPKNAAGDAIIIDFYGSKNKQCRRMLKTIDFIAEQYQGLVQKQVHLVKSESKLTQQFGLDNLPAIIFKRGNKKIAKHEGSISISALQSKINTLLEGANISDSSSVDSIKDLKKVNRKELYAMGEYLMFYFSLHNCGICKKTKPVIEKAGKKFSKVKFESVMVDGSHALHRSFGVTHVPSVVFVRLGKVIGKHVGYINPSNLEELMDKFTKSSKTKMGLTEYGDSRIIPGEEEKVKNKA
jgi:thioredoxin 1